MTTPASLPDRVMAFVPYREEDGRLVSPHYDLPEYRAEIGGWMQEIGAQWDWIPVTVSSLTDDIARASAAAAGGSSLVFNLCDGTAADGYPGLEVVDALTAAGIPFTGAGPDFFRLTTSKAASKTQFRAAGVPTAPWVLARTVRDIARAAAALPFPLFVKPDVSAGSYGIQIGSMVRDFPSVWRRFEILQAGLHGQHFEHEPVLIERFIEGREFTVLVVEDPSERLGLHVVTPGERVFDARVPVAERFLAFERYWGLPEDERPIPQGDRYYWYALAPSDLRPILTDLARRAFRAVGGEGYARVDIRHDERSGQFMVLEVNAQCSLSASDSSTVGSILRLCNERMVDIIARILRHGMARVSVQRPTAECLTTLAAGAAMSANCQ